MLKSWIGVLLLLLILEASAFPRTAKTHQNHLVLIALDSSSYANALKFAVSVNSSSTVPISISIYAKQSDTGGSSVAFRRGTITAESLEDDSVSRKVKVEEKVTAILDALKTEVSYINKNAGAGTGSGHDSFKSSVVVSVSFRDDSTPMPTADFQQLFDAFDQKHSGTSPTRQAADTGLHLLLLEKNRHLRTESTWHDLMVLGLRICPATQRWLNTLRDVFMRHAQRKAFALLVPRFAIREASIRDPTLRIRYFQAHEISVNHGTHTHSHSNSHSSQSSNNKKSVAAYINVTCTERSGGCTAVHDESMRWRNTPEARQGVPTTWASRAKTSDERLAMNPLVTMWSGVIRFRAEAGKGAQAAQAKTGNESFPRQFCWQSPGSEEKRASARVEYSFGNSSTFVHSINDLSPPPTTTDRKHSVMIVTGTRGEAAQLDEVKYNAISKMYYCKRHGYLFTQLLSSQYIQFFPHNLFETCKNVELRPMLNEDGSPGRASYGTSVMSKVVMIAEAMLEHYASSHGSGDLWTVWTDDDVWINPGWLYLPLYSAYLESVPKEKLFVSSNYRSAFTNVFAIRNTIEGRALVYDWLSIVVSGRIQCHGYDQAALQVLILLRTLDDAHAGMLASPATKGPRAFTVRTSIPSATVAPTTATTTTARDKLERDVSAVFKYATHAPFNHTCLLSTDAPGMGCDGGFDWSCDFKFEAAMSRAGYTTSKQEAFHNGIISSYSKGCANDYVPDFHIVSETSRRPRLQCGLCTRLSEIGSTGGYDGPLGGGNDKLLRGSINGWFFNHKVSFLFWEAYLDSQACSYLAEAEFIPPCDHSSHENDATYDGTAHVQQHASVISLTDGYAFDVVAGKYCRVTQESMLNEQKSKTYMKDYAKMTARVTFGYTEEQWVNRYRHFGGGDGRVTCGRDDTNRDQDDATLWASLKAKPEPDHPDSDYTKPNLRPKNCPHGAREDNMAPIERDDENKIFERADFCTECRVNPASWSPRRYVVSCKND